MARDQVQDLQADANQNHRLFQRFTSESKAVSIAGIALVVAALALMMSWMAVYDALHVKAVLEADTRSATQSYHLLEREYRLLQAKVDRHRAAMLAHGIDPEFRTEEKEADHE